MHASIIHTMPDCYPTHYHAPFRCARTHLLGQERVRARTAGTTPPPDAHTQLMSSHTTEPAACAAGGKCSAAQPAPVHSYVMHVATL